MFSDYQVLRSVDLQELTYKVNKLLDEGYVPLGGVTTTLTLKGTPYYTQAVAKMKVE